MCIIRLQPFTDNVLTTGTIRHSAIKVYCFVYNFIITYGNYRWTVVKHIYTPFGHLFVHVLENNTSTAIISTWHRQFKHGDNNTISWSLLNARLYSCHKGQRSLLVNSHLIQKRALYPKSLNDVMMNRTTDCSISNPPTNKLYSIYIKLEN